MKKSNPIKSNSEKKFISRRGLATRWETSVMTLRRLQQAGKLKPYHFGRDCRYALSDVEAIEQASLVA